MGMERTWTDGVGGLPDVVAWNGDCVPGMAELPAESVGLCVTSIPFGALFMYSGKTEDIGNCVDTAEGSADGGDATDFEASQFGLNMRFFCHQLKRAMMPGRNVCVHIQQLLRYKNQHGYMGRRDFRGAVVEIFCRSGFEWIGEFAIPKNPQVIAQRLKLHSLQFKTGHSVDSCKLAPAVMDYVMVFQKPGENAEPVLALANRETNPEGWVTSEEWIRDAHGLWKDAWEAWPEESAALEGLKNLLSRHVDGDLLAWLAARPDLVAGVWGDISEIDVLDGWKSARESDEEKHVCPLQLSVIRRCVRYYTNRGDVVLDPFGGIGSSAVVAMEEGRVAWTYELKESYFGLLCRNVDLWRGRLGRPRQPELFAVEGGR